MWIPEIHRVSARAAAVTAVAICVAGCGSGSSTSTTSGASRAASAPLTARAAMAARYLASVRAYNAVARQPITLGVDSAVTIAYEAALRRFDAQVLALGAHGTTHADIQALVSDDVRTLDAVERGNADAYDASVSAGSRAADAVGADLGIPQTQP